MNQKQSLNIGWNFFSEQKNRWNSAKVPGYIHQDLIDNDEILDPFFGKNEEGLGWVGKKNWTYKLEFTPKKEIYDQKTIRICFEGVDTFANIYINGNLIISSNNMFHPWTADVKEFLKAGQNELTVKFRSPLDEVSSKMESLNYTLPADNDQAGKTSPHTRKAPYHYGWDWGPSLVSSGIWKDVCLMGYDEWYINNLIVSNKQCNLSEAKLEVEVHIYSKIKDVIKINISEPKSGVDQTMSTEIVKGLNTFKHEVVIQKPDLWWPAGHGNQPLYDFNVNVESENFSESKAKRIGIRDVFIKRSKDSRGESFEIYVNDTPIFSKGANWIPADSFTTRLTRQDYKKLILSATEANMNTLRVWGGGIYEPDCFYELCDEFGILVWQDFMFACSMYPADKDFLKSVEKEARYQVNRLKSFACIILWCGNNEIASGWLSWGWKEELPKTIWDDYKKLFHVLLPEVCNEIDPSRLYWPSSPGHDLNLPKEDQIYGKGDNHYWGVWHSGEDFEGFEQNIGRFMSEYGMQSFPSIKTINSFSKKEDQSIDSAVMNAHQKASLGTKNLLMYIEKYYLMPSQFTNVVELSQIMQADAIKFAVESHRRNMPFCMGTLYWQFNDCWPGISWSSIDYRGDWKALHYAARDFYSPVLICIKKNQNNLDFFIINDQDKTFEAEVNIQICLLNGKVLKEDKKVVLVGPTNSDCIFTYDMISDGLFSSFNFAESFVCCEILKKDTVISSNEFFFVKPKELALSKPDYEFSYKKNGDNFSLSIKANTFMYRLFIQSGNVEGHFSENYFHMKPGVMKEIIFKPVIKDLKDVPFKVLSLHDLT